MADDFGEKASQLCPVLASFPFVVSATKRWGGFPRQGFLDRVAFGGTKAENGSAHAVTEGCVVTRRRMPERAFER